jgi:hypothetical protein
VHTIYLHKMSRLPMHPAKAAGSGCGQHPAPVTTLSGCSSAHSLRMLMRAPSSSNTKLSSSLQKPAQRTFAIYEHLRPSSNSISKHIAGTEATASSYTNSCTSWVQQGPQVTCNALQI